MIACGDVTVLLFSVSKPLLSCGRTFTTNQGKINAFMKVYAAVNSLNFSRTEAYSSLGGSPQLTNGGRSLLPTVPAIGI